MAESQNSFTQNWTNMQQVFWRNYIAYIYTPSSDLYYVEVGDVFQHANGKRFKLVERNIIKCIVIRWTWWDDFKAKLRGEQVNVISASTERSNGS